MNTGSIYYSRKDILVEILSFIPNTFAAVKLHGWPFDLFTLTTSSPHSNLTRQHSRIQEGRGGRAVQCRGCLVVWNLKRRELKKDGIILSSFLDRMNECCSTLLLHCLTFWLYCLYFLPLCFLTYIHFPNITPP